jgi:Trk-type K+ transport system membrane component
MSLLDQNMIPFAGSPFILLSLGLFILAGNTCYPVFLRLFIWSLHRSLPATPRFRDAKHTLQFLLNHPRRCYTNLFPSAHTWWLLGAVVVLNGIDCIMYVVLNIGNPFVSHASSAGIEFVDGLFQAFAVRSGGFYVKTVSNLRIGLQVLYAIMMYISAYPIAISIRNSNVYEERSLGIYADDPYYPTWQEDERRRLERERRHRGFKGITGSMKRLVRMGGGMIRGVGARDPYLVNSQDTGIEGVGSRWMFVQQQFRAQLAHDLWWLILAVWLIVVVETGQIEKDPADFSVFNVIFEVVSGKCMLICGCWILTTSRLWHCWNLYWRAWCELLVRWDVARP